MRDHGRSAVFGLVGMAFVLSLTAQVAGGDAKSDVDDQIQKNLTEICNELSPTKDIHVAAFPGDKVTQFQIQYPAAEEALIIGPAGRVQTMLQDLTNELSIALQKNEAAVALQPFDISQRRVHQVRFVRVDH